MCWNCLRFVRRRRIRSLDDLYRVAEWLRPYVNNGKLKFIQGGPPIEEIHDFGVPVDSYFLIFRCPKCAREFHLRVRYDAGDWR